MLFRPHTPGFVNDGEPAEGPQEFNTLEELREVPQVKRFLSGGATLQKAFTKPHGAIPTTEHLLMAVLPDGKYLVVGYMSPDQEVWDRLDLPVWSSRDSG